MPLYTLAPTHYGAKMLWCSLTQFQPANKHLSVIRLGKSMVYNICHERALREIPTYFAPHYHQPPHHLHSVKPPIPASPVASQVHHVTGYSGATTPMALLFSVLFWINTAFSATRTMASKFA